MSELERYFVVVRALFSASVLLLFVSVRVSEVYAICHRTQTILERFLVLEDAI